ncbi:hypothetical protein [uncultured Flavobacterium sp.]|uniref:hypothetical protein n=1 Tax=uncultured Flavobacterium sp. TaxID=165435 RepID=UPI002600BB75|nr:hypothetical protein [uncultured Flavobacterium sp.]
MNQKYKISIPEPCHENWEEMLPTENGRFCQSCTKNVIDFTRMSPISIQEYFIANSKKEVCGRFRNEQLKTLHIQIPNEIFYSELSFHKIFLLALLLTMGTTLFSCSGNNGEKQKIESVKIVADKDTISEKIDTVCEKKQIPERKIRVVEKYEEIVLSTTGEVALEPYKPKVLDSINKE